MNNKLFITPEIFNVLVSVLDFFIASENEIGKTFFSEYAAKLKKKMLTHGRIIKRSKNEISESVVINFYGNEAVMLIKLLSYYFSLDENNTVDYFAELKQKEDEIISAKNLR